MRIAMLVRRFDPAGGGTERDFAAAADCLSRGGHEVRIYAARSRIVSWHGRAVRTLPLARVPRSVEALGFGLLADRFARREGAELTVSFGRTVDSDFVRCEGGAHAGYLRAARQWESRAASAVRALSLYHAAQCRMEEAGFRSSRLRMVLAISRLVADELERRFGIPRSNVEVLYNGVDSERFKNGSDRRLHGEIRRRLGIDGSDSMVLFVGNGFGRKGLGKMIQAWPAVREKACLVVAGQDRALSFYQRMTRRLRVDNRIMFLGRRNDVPDLLAAADVAALPSLFEAFGNVVLEGMAAGLPVLTSARCGAAEILPPQLKEFVVQDPMNSEEIAHRLNALLSAPQELGKVARSAAQEFTWERFGRQFLACIERAVEPRLSVREG
jgi:UDP-glucose:(heptosyl)LPS alpha-1,3-glucosyltransferase